MANKLIYLALTDITLDPELDRYNPSKKPGSGKKGEEFYYAAIQSEDDDRLRESLRTVGMREPLIVRKQGNKWVLVDGYRRYYQVKYLADHKDLGPYLDPSALPCFVEDAHIESITSVRLETNERRQALPPSLQAKKFRELMEVHGRTIPEIATMCALSPPSVSNYLVITKCIPEVQKAIDAGHLPLSAGKVFSILTEEGQRKLWRKVSGVPGVTRAGLWRVANKFQDRLFRRPKRERMERSEHIRRAKRGQIQNRGKTRSYLEGDLSSVTDELQFKEAQLQKVRTELMPLVRWWVTSLRNPSILKYMIANEQSKLEDIETILSLEAGYERRK